MQDRLTVEVPVTNTGDCDGYETVHWFVSDPSCRISRPLKELKFFEKKWIRKGETVNFVFEVDLQRDFGYVDDEGKRFLEKGDYFVSVKNQKIKIELN